MAGQSTLFLPLIYCINLYSLFPVKKHEFGQRSNKKQKIAKFYNPVRIYTEPFGTKAFGLGVISKRAVPAV